MVQPSHLVAESNAVFEPSWSVARTPKAFRARLGPLCTRPATAERTLAWTQERSWRHDLRFPMPEACLARRLVDPEPGPGVGECC